MPKKFTALILMLIDIAVVASTPFLALFIRFEGNVDSRYYKMLLEYLPVIIIVRLAIFYFFGLYHRLWRYASINELLIIAWAVTAGTIALTAYMYFSGAVFPRSMYILTWLFNIVLVGASRLCIRVLAHLRYSRPQQCTRVLIVGAGDAGAMIAREVEQRYVDHKKVVGFIDDDPYKRNKILFGAKVLGTRQDISRIVKEQGVNEIIIAMPSAGGEVIREVIRACPKGSCAIKTVPGIYELIDGKVKLEQLRNVDLEDLLKREPVRLDLTEIAEYLQGKRVLVTGAGGSIGSELCRQIAKIQPETLILLGKGENSIYEIERELREKHGNLELKPIIADIRDQTRINNIFARFRPQVIFHAAAHKHVPLMEAQPEEAVRNNIFGTKVVAEAADRAGAEIFIMISTDKAVNPTSVMGATKRVAELIIQNINSVSTTKFAAVRFGNVLGSRGSVIPLFKKQIAQGGPVTITHPDMKRYFMTIPEATQLVLQAGAIAQGGEVFVLDMGEPVKIVDMARDLIQLSGLDPDRDIKVKITGLRPGEKLFEELLTAEEGTTSTKHEKIYAANLKTVDEQQLQQGLRLLQSAIYPDEIIHMLAKLIPTYHSSREKYCGAEIKEIKLAINNAGDIVQYQAVSDLH